MHIDHHKYDEADTRLLLRTPIFEQAMKIYEREAPEFLAERGFPTDVRERHDCRVREELRLNLTFTCS